MHNPKENPKALLKKLYTYTIFSNLMFIFPFYGIIFADNGLDAMQISLLFIVSTVVKVICEVPSGVLADTHSRRNLLVIAQVLRIASLGLWLIWPTFWGFALGFVLWGMGASLISGTVQALLYDELKAIGKEEQYLKISGRLGSLSLGSIVASTLLASPAILFGYPFVLGISMAAAGLAAIIAFALPNPKRQKSLAAADTSIMQDLRTAQHNVQLLRITLFALYIGLIGAIVQEYSPLFTRESGIPNALIPVILAGMIMPAVIAGTVAHKFKLSARALIVLLATCGFLMFLCGYFIGLAGLVFVAMLAALIQFLRVVFDSKLQHTITGNARATLTSVNAFATQMAIVVGFAIYGWVANGHKNAGAFMLFGALTVIVAVCYLGITHGKLFILRRSSG
jgi:MFS family permease